MMNRLPRQARLNRAMFSQRPLDSGALTVLATLYHHFREPGDYDIVIQRGGQTVRRLYVRVEKESGPAQLSFDLADPGDSDADCCCCDDEPSHVLRLNGVIAFYVSQGMGQYTVTITWHSGEEKRVVLDSSAALPEGDLFAVTPVRPGGYSLTNREAQAQGRIRVAMPRPGKYRPDEVALVEAVEGGFKPEEVSIFAGQSVVIMCRVPARLRVELTEPEQPGPVEPVPGQPTRQRHTIRRPPRRKPEE